MPSAGTASFPGDSLLTHKDCSHRRILYFDTGCPDETVKIRAHRRPEEILALAGKTLSHATFAIPAISVPEHLQLTYNRERLRVKYLIGTNALPLLQHHCPRI
jgi:hypothetical protein